MIRTRDYGLAAFLACEGRRWGVENHTGEVWFIFEGDDKEQAKARYFGGAQMPAKELVTAIRTMREIIWWFTADKE